MPSRDFLLTTLRFYQKTWCEARYLPELQESTFDQTTCQKFLNFVEGNQNCFLRANLPGHVTGSALVLNHDLTRVLLTHHKKLGMWLQLGGHADGHHVIHEVAMTEAVEESGIRFMHFLPYEAPAFGSLDLTWPLPFDLDRHLIPANSRDPEHHHYDVRYILTCNSDELPIVSEESHDVRWFTFDEARKITREVSMWRQFSKVEWLKKTFKL